MKKGMGPGGRNLGATDQGAEPGATSAATSCHAGSAASHLGAKIHDAETCYLGSASHGAELRVHFPNSLQQGSNCELLSQKGPKSKKKGRNYSPLNVKRFIIDTHSDIGQ
jgi:hypothetical protein